MTIRGPSPWTLASLAVALLLSSVEPSSAQTRNLILLATHGGPSELVPVVDDCAYVAGGDTLRIVDVSNPSAPVEWSTYTAPDRIYGLHANGDRVYLAGGLEGLQIIDVSSPTTPRLVSRHVTPGQAVDVTTVGTSALVVNLMTGLEVVDLSTPRAPRLLVTQDTPGYQRAVSSDGSRVFVVDQPTGVVLFDLSTPASPAELGTHPSLTAPARSVTTDPTNQNRLYVVYEGTGLVEVLDISNPERPQVVGSYAPEGRPQRVAVAGSSLYVPKGQAGIEVVDMSDPTAPSISAAYDTPGTARMIAVTDHLIVVADDDALLLLRQR